MSAPLSIPAPLPRHVLVVGSVLALHVAALWALQSGLVQRTVEAVVPVAMLSEIVSPPAPVPAAARPLPVPKPAVTPAPRQAVKQPAAEPTPAAVAVPAPSSAAEAPAPTPAAAATPAPAPAPAKVELPRKDADYLRNPPPAYPPMSHRLGEEGLVVVRVLIGIDGAARDARVHQSSGFERLDNAALKAARNWRYVPGQRGGTPEAMWVDVPVKWELKKP